MPKNLPNSQQSQEEDCRGSQFHVRLCSVLEQRNRHRHGCSHQQVRWRTTRTQKVVAKVKEIMAGKSAYMESSEAEAKEIAYHYLRTHYV